jgi:hypothetical protein
MVVAPAYGRDYSSSQKALDAWKSGVDFKLMPSGQYCSIRDFPSEVMEIRYSKLTRLVFFHP